MGTMTLGKDAEPFIVSVVKYEHLDSEYQTMLWNVRVWDRFFAIGDTETLTRSLTFLQGTETMYMPMELLTGDSAKKVSKYLREYYMERYAHMNQKIGARRVLVEKGSAKFGQPCLTRRINAWSVSWNCWSDQRTRSTGREWSTGLYNTLCLTLAHFFRCHVQWLWAFYTHKGIKLKKKITSITVIRYGLIIWIYARYVKHRQWWSPIFKHNYVKSCAPLVDSLTLRTHLLRLESFWNF